jgi:hypothetical protein
MRFDRTARSATKCRRRFIGQPANLAGRPSDEAEFFRPKWSKVGGKLMTFWGSEQAGPIVGISADTIDPIDSISDFGLFILRKRPARRTYGGRRFRHGRAAPRQAAGKPASSTIPSCGRRAYLAYSPLFGPQALRRNFRVVWRQGDAFLMWR